MTIKVENINKKYSKKDAIFSNFSLEIEGGKVIGLLGENGIGKTTLLKMIADLAKPDSGTITINGQEVSYNTRDMISWLIEVENLEWRTKVKDAIAYYHDFFPDFDMKKCEALCEAFNIKTNDKIANLSKGQGERVCLMLCLSRRAPFYVLDEPMAGFDPKFKKELISAILSHVEEGQTLLISSHLLKDLDALLDRVIILTHNKATIADADEIRARGISIEDFYLEVVE